MVVEVIFPDGFLLALLYWWVPGVVRRWPPHRLRHPACSTPSKACKGAKLFPGLTRKAHCAACEAAAGAHPPQPPAPPRPVIPYQGGRPREVDTYTHDGPNDGCAYYGWSGRGHSRANGYPNGRCWRQLRWVRSLLPGNPRGGIFGQDPIGRGYLTCDRGGGRRTGYLRGRAGVRNGT